MGYKIINVSPEMKEKYVERCGLEGPFFYDGNKVLYYCPKEGKYLNPETDVFLSYDEYVSFVS